MRFSGNRHFYMLAITHELFKVAAPLQQKNNSKKIMPLNYRIFVIKMF